jgi:CO dehydrogenase/acetyl-CoA synthase beta subunit
MSKNLVRMTTKSQYRVTNIPLAVYDPILGQYEKTTIDSLEHFLRNELQGVVTVDSLQQTKSTLASVGTRTPT